MTKAHTIRNYPGLPDITGTDLADKLKHHLDVMGVEITEKQVTTVYSMGSYFGIQTPDIMYEASSVILAGGVVMGKPFPGEDELLGRGVSYCATCDAHFYKGKAVAVLGYNSESCREADFLAETCARVLYFPVVPHEVNVGPNVTVVRERVLSIPGTMRAEGVPDRQRSAPRGRRVCAAGCRSADKLVPGLATDGPHVAVDAQMRTNLPGCFACGDLAGKPTSISRLPGRATLPPCRRWNGWPSRSNLTKQWQNAPSGLRWDRRGRFVLCGYPCTSTTLTSFTLVPVGPVTSSPPTACKAW